MSALIYFVVQLKKLSRLGILKECVCANEDTTCIIILKHDMASQRRRPQPSSGMGAKKKVSQKAAKDINEQSMLQTNHRPTSTLRMRQKRATIDEIRIHARPADGDTDTDTDTISSFGGQVVAVNL